MTGPESGAFLPVGTPVDLTNCEREPIHIPGSVQPHGALVTFHGPAGTVQQASSNASLLLGRSRGDVLGLTLQDLFDRDSVHVLAAAMAGGRVSTTGAPLRVQALDAPPTSGSTPSSTAAVTRGSSRSSLSPTRSTSATRCAKSAPRSPS
jgi:hypothetical protein